MTIRNQNNDRYKDGGKKNVARTSPGRAKIKSKAGSSVYVKTKDAKAKRKEEEARAGYTTGQVITVDGGFII